MNCVVCDTTELLTQCKTCNADVCVQCIFKQVSKTCAHCRADPMVVMMNGNELSVPKADGDDEEDDVSFDITQNPKCLFCPRHINCLNRHLYLAGPFKNTCIEDIVHSNLHAIDYDYDMGIPICDTCIYNLRHHFQNFQGELARLHIQKDRIFQCRCGVK